MTKASNACEDFVSGFRPHEGLGVPVRDLDVCTDGGFELPGAPMDPAAQLLVREGGEPALHEIDPRASGRREVDVEA